MKTIVTGGAGFIGSNLCYRLLKLGYEVICIDNLLTGSKKNIADFIKKENFKFIEFDVINPLPSNLKCDVVFHLASPASPNHHSKISYHSLPVETMLVNTQGTYNLLKFCQQKKAKFLFTSSSEVYGNPDITPQKETYNGNVSTTGPRSVYDEAKRFGETITAHFMRNSLVDARIARIFNTYGPRMDLKDGRAVVNLAVQALTNQPMTVYGRGNQTRSFCYVSDMVTGIKKAIFAPRTRGQIINLGNPEELTILQLAKKIQRVTKTDSKIIHEDLPEDDPDKRRPDISRAKKLLSWQPKVSFTEGLKKTLTYFEDALKKLP